MSVWMKMTCSVPWESHSWLWERSFQCNAVIVDTDGGWCEVCLSKCVVLDLISTWDLSSIRAANVFTSCIVGDLLKTWLVCFSINSFNIRMSVPLSLVSFNTWFVNFSLFLMNRMSFINEKRVNAVIDYRAYNSRPIFIQKPFQKRNYASHSCLLPFKKNFWLCFYF